MTLNYSPTER